ncbi:hypothetical protein M8818_002402 [Zalaria obscura]|uniref:Uncharacterized protein n=1 Tax=Zalaria obscura TaxID=2024903 RepID=A0ACC3SM56_9PEZI
MARFLIQLLKMLSDANLKEAYSVRCVELKRKDRVVAQIDLEFKAGDAKSAKPLGSDITARTRGPLSIASLLGCLMSIGLLVASAARSDGMSLLATILLSFLSTLIGIGNKWKLQLRARNSSINAPPGDVVIRYANGSFLVVKCDEEIARELYFAPEDIQYMVSQAWVYRLISLVGTLMLMGGVIALANARLELQIAWAGAFITLNAIYWIIAALPQRLHWDLSCFEIREVGIEGGPVNENYTQALWRTIVVTQSTAWVKISHSAPRTEAWINWLDAAQMRASEASRVPGETINPRWNPSEAKNNMFKVPHWDPQAVLKGFIETKMPDKPIVQATQ